MNSLSQVAEQKFQEMLEPLMIAIQYDAQMTRGQLYTNEQLLQRAMALHIYALSKGKQIKIDPTTQLVIME